MFKNASWAMAGGLTVALLLPLMAGCSSPCGGRSCPKGSAAPHGGPSVVAPVAVPSALPGSPTAAALPFGGQKTCPMTGEELGSMGKPLTVTLKGQTVYVCCRGCVAKAQADADKTLAAVAADRAR